MMWFNKKSQGEKNESMMALILSEILQNRMDSL